MAKSSGRAPAPPSASSPQALSSAGVRMLRARAHALKPVVRIAASGPTEGVVRELDRALRAHELVKIHAASDDREERSRLLLALCEQLGAQPVQTIGKMLVAYRPNPEGEEKPAPARRSRAVEARPKARRAGRPAQRPAKRAAGAGARRRRA